MIRFQNDVVTIVYMKKVVSTKQNSNGKEFLIVKGFRDRKMPDNTIERDFIDDFIDFFPDVYKNYQKAFVNGEFYKVTCQLYFQNWKLHINDFVDSGVKK